jgi:hypothetical protein
MTSNRKTVEGVPITRTPAQAVSEFRDRRRRDRREARDLEILNRAAEALNREVEDTLAYQVKP